MKYYFVMIDEKTIAGLERADIESNPIVLERWDKATGKWVFNPDTYSGVSGFSSDADNYKEVTKQEADKYRKKS